MKAKFIIVVMFLLLAPAINGQVVIEQTMSVQEAGNLLKSLNGKMADTTRIDILLKLAEHNLHKTSYKRLDLDSATTFIRNATDLNAKQSSRKRDGRILLDESSLTRKKGDANTGLQLIKGAIGQLQATNDEFLLVLAYLELSRYYDSQKPEQEAASKDAFNKSFQLVQKMAGRGQLSARKFALRSFYHLEMSYDGHPIKLYFLNKLVMVDSVMKDRENQLWARKEIADIHSQQGKLDLAISELVQIAKEQKAGGYHQVCFTYDLLSGLYRAIGNYDKALSYALETMRNIHTKFDSTYLPDFYGRVADSYSLAEGPNESLEWNIKKMNLMISRKTTYGIYSLLYNITSDMIVLGRSKEALDLLLEKSRTIVPASNGERQSMLLSLACCYAGVDEKRTAEKYFNEVARLMEQRVKQKEIKHDVIADRVIAEFYYDDGQYSKAEPYFRKALREWTGDRNLALYYTNYFLFTIDSAKGDYLAAIKDLNVYYEIHDSIHSATKQHQLEELKITYATEQKDSLISLKEQNIQLLTKQDMLQKSKLQQTAVLRNISFAVVALLIIIMALLYNRYRLKQKTNRKLELQQEEIAKQNFSLQHLVNEKEWLLKEIHHRVKNNLQVVMSLLNSQSAYIDNDAALTAIHDSQHRVHAMSLIHQKLYNSENVSSIDMSFYTRELVSYLRDSFDTGHRIRFELNIEPLKMDVSQAVPLGLILNEAITNSIKYAFPHEKSGVISVSLSDSSANHYLLSISDNGVGLPADFRKTGSLGMSLMKGLSEDLDGNFSIESNNGTLIKISFVHHPILKQSDITTRSVASKN
jgi:two-component sensor histidine kinase